MKGKCVGFSTPTKVINCFQFCSVNLGSFKKQTENQPLSLIMKHMWPPRIVKLQMCYVRYKYLMSFKGTIEIVLLLLGRKADISIKTYRNLQDDICISPLFFPLSVSEQGPSEN